LTPFAFIASTVRDRTRRPATADRTARRQFQATGQLVSQTQASDAVTSRMPRYEAKCVCNAGASNAGRSLCVQISRERSYPCQYIDTIRKAYTAYTARTPCTGRVRAVYTAKSVYRAVFTTVIRPCTAVYTAENVYTAV